MICKNIRKNYVCVYRDIFQSSFRFTGKLIGKYRVPIYTPSLPYTFKKRNGKYLKYLTGEWLKKNTYGISTGRKSHSHFGMLTVNRGPWWHLGELCSFYLCVFPKFQGLDACYLVTFD